MARITTLMTSQMLLANIEMANDRMAVTEEQLSSGKRINQPSDDPYGTSQAILIGGQLSALDSYQTGISDGMAWSQSADSALGSMNDVLQRVRELVVEASNGTNSASDQAAAAAEVDQLIASVKQLANTQYAGQYVFSGTSTTTAPYQSGSVDTYGGGSGQVLRTIGPSTSIPVNVDISSALGNGQNIVSGQDQGDGKLLDVLRTIAQDMRAGTPAAAAALGHSDLTNLDTNMDALSAIQATVGATENRLSMAASRVQDLQVSQTQLLSNTEDTDMAQASVDFSTEQAAYQAALRAGANIVQSSLMDFLSTS